MELRQVRTIAIGDIHGCRKSLAALIEVIHPTKDDLLVFLGDYVDRGPDSRGTLDLLIEIQRDLNAVFLRGNHEIMFGGCAIHGIDPSLWLQMGGRTTLVSYGGKLESVTESHRDFLRTCLPYFETNEHFFCHANYIPHLELDAQPERTLYWEHLHERLPGPHFSGKTAWVGHSPQIHGMFTDFGHLVCLDTFCFGGMYLTAMDVDSREYWQADKWGNLRGNRSPAIKLAKWCWKTCHRIFGKQKNYLEGTKETSSGD